MYLVTKPLLESEGEGNLAWGCIIFLKAKFEF